MVSFISKFLFTATVTAPTFLSLGLVLLRIARIIFNYGMIC